MDSLLLIEESKDEPLSSSVDTGMYLVFVDFIILFPILYIGLSNDHEVVVNQRLLFLKVEK